MLETRSIRKVIRSKPTVEGAGVHLRRAFGYAEVPEFDPFLLLDDFRSDQPAEYLAGFPWHPHRGIQTITYVLQGEVEHGDSLGNQGVIGPGDVQWMAAGSGIIHQEMPRGDALGSMGGFQLWLNLPSHSKMTVPRYQEVSRDEIPSISTEYGTVIRIIAGEAMGKSGPVRDELTAAEYLDVTIPPRAQFTHTIPRGQTVFAYIFQGRGRFDAAREPSLTIAQRHPSNDAAPRSLLENGDLVLFGDGDQVMAATEEDAVRFLLISGRPLKEPVAWHGPIVMNTQEELRTALEELRKGTFIRKA
jgi:redox-sensitive bicupin YhaK (pirin superfamily)